MKKKYNNNDSGNDQGLWLLLILLFLGAGAWVVNKAKACVCDQEDENFSIDLPEPGFRSEANEVVIDVEAYERESDSDIRNHSEPELHTFFNPVDRSFVISKTF